MNSRLTRLLKQSREQLVGTPLFRMLDKDNAAVVKRVLKHAVSRRSGDRFTCIFLTPEREALTFEVVVTPIIESGEVTMLGCLGRDITQEVVLERKLWDTAESHYQAVDFALRNSLGLIKGYVYTLGQATDVDHERRRRYVGVIEEEMYHLSAMIEDLLDLKRADAGHFETRGEMISPTEYVHEAVEQCRPEAERREVQLKSKLPDGGAALFVTPEAFHRAVFNLVQYAVQQSLHSAVVDVELVDSTAYVELTIRATGAMLDGDEATKMFDRTVRGGLACGSGIESGISLTVARTLVTALGGKVWVKCDKSIGLEIRMMVPRRLDGLDADESFDTALLLSTESEGETVH